MESLTYNNKSYFYDEFDYNDDESFLAIQPEHIQSLERDHIRVLQLATDPICGFDTILMVYDSYKLYKRVMVSVKYTVPELVEYLEEMIKEIRKT